MQTIYPMLRYADAREAIRWLCDAFGFQVRFSVPETGPFVRHAQLDFGGAIVMLGSTRPGEDFKSPREAGVRTG